MRCLPENKHLRRHLLVVLFWLLIRTEVLFRSMILIYKRNSMELNLDNSLNTLLFQLQFSSPPPPPHIKPVLLGHNAKSNARGMLCGGRGGGGGSDVIKVRYDRYI